MTGQNNIAIRPLTPDDCPAYRALRQNILESGEGKFFGYSFIRERQFTEDQLRDWLIETPKHCIMGTFVDGELIGIMGIVACKTIPYVVEWDDTWIAPKYRKLGVAKLAYEKVFQWTKDHKYDFAIVIIREDNRRCLEIRLRQGFSYVDTKPNDIWVDGSRAASKSYMLNLNEEKALQKQTLNQLEEALESFATTPMHENLHLLEKTSHALTQKF